jgi:hypothetical protein
MGWGDIKGSVAFKALTDFGTPAMHTTYYHRIVENENCIKIKISQEQYGQLIRYLKDRLKKVKTILCNILLQITRILAQMSSRKQKASYSLFKTCNSWANTSLKAALWTATDTGIFEK